MGGNNARMCVSLEKEQMLARLLAWLIEGRRIRLGWLDGGQGRHIESIKTCGYRRKDMYVYEDLYESKIFRPTKLLLLSCC